MPLRIAFDLDGVLADMEAELPRQSEILFGPPATPVPREDVPAGTTPDAGAADEAADGVAGAGSHLGPARLQLSTRQVRRLWRHVASIDGFWESLNEIEPGAVARLAALVAERRWEV